MADDERVVGQADHLAGVDPIDAQAAIGILAHLGAPEELHDLRVFVARQLPGVPGREPIVVALDLLAVFDALLEDAEVVADAVAGSRELERGE